jgi:hypothetical protein
MELKAKSTSWGGCNLWKNNEVEFFDLTGTGVPPDERSQPRHRELWRWLTSGAWQTGPTHP